MKYLAVLILLQFLSAPLFGQEIRSLSPQTHNDNNLTKPPEDSVYAVKIELGIRDEVIHMYTKLYDYSSINESIIQAGALPINFHLTAGLRLFENYKLDYRIGLMYVYEDFYGIDKGLFLQADLFKSFYGTVGIDFINNGGDAHGVTIYSGAGGKTTFYCFGLGYNLSKHFTMDLMYYYPKDKVFGYNIDNMTGKRYDKIDNGCIVLGIQYCLILKVPNDKH